MNLEPAIALIKRFEGFRAKPYLCPAGIPTIGYGATFYEDGSKVKLIDPAITEPRAVELLMHMLHTQFIPGLIRQCPILLWDELKFNAILVLS